MSAEIEALLNQYQHVMLDNLRNEPSHRRDINYPIDLEPGAKPIAVPTRMMSFDELEDMKTQLKELVSQRIFRSSVSPYATLVLFVVKKDGTIRMCADY